MVAATLTNGATDLSADGLRPINLTTDLPQLADLMELGFADALDESGRAIIREMRTLGRVGWLNSAVNRLDGLFGGLQQGFVWIEDGRLVGNVSIMPIPYSRAAESGGAQGAIIANVVVQPAHRRRGFARSLMSAALDRIEAQGRGFAVLQVDADNAGARRLYEQLGFREQRTFTRWVRPPRMRPPYPLPDIPPITLRPARDWRAEYVLAERVRPRSRGGLGWLRPTYPGTFRPSLLKGVGDALTGRATESWAVYHSPSQAIIAVVRLYFAFGSSDRFDLLVDPAAQALYGRPNQPAEALLLNYLLRRVADRHRATMTEHPVDDVIGSAALREYGFEARRTEVAMRLDLRSQLNK
jgi:ribosomal protein S18 acetylase RimI-like enzyme